MQTSRRKTKIIKIGNVYIGGNNPVAIQSMVKTKTSDVEKTIKQIKELKKIGCEIVRLAVRDNTDAQALRRIKSKAKLPLVADIHFDWRLALQAIDSGVDKIRLNPGNIYKKDQIREIVKAAKLSRIPIRVGVNSGSLRSRQSSVGFRRSAGRVDRRSLADKMVKSALDYIKILEGFKFYDLVISLKTPHIFDTIEAYRRMSRFCDYPFHLGVTATGLPYSGVIKSSIAIGILLSQGIGDTIRISLTDKPEEEVKSAKCILDSLGLRHFAGLQILSCPTCGRCEVDLIRLVKDFKNKLDTVKPKLPTKNRQPLKVALMGCVVNGPGEAKEADLGIAFGKDEGLLFKRGTPIKKVSADICIDRLLKEMERMDG